MEFGAKEPEKRPSDRNRLDFQSDQLTVDWLQFPMQVLFSQKYVFLLTFEFLLGFKLFLFFDSSGKS